MHYFFENFLFFAKFLSKKVYQNAKFYAKLWLQTVRGNKKVRFSSFKEILTHFSNNRNPALIYDKNGVKTPLSFAELLSLVEKREKELSAEGKTSIGVFCAPTPECIATIFAAAALKMQVVMLDDGIADESIALQIKMADIDSLYADDKDTEEDFKRYLTSGVEKGANRILFFTSGTTSTSKAVVLTEQSLCNSAYNGSAKLPLTQGDTLLCLLPLAHVFGFICSLLWGLSCGATVALSRGARYLPLDMGYFEPTAVSVVPMLLGFMLQQKLLNANLKTILVGAGDCPQPLLDAAAAMGKHVSFGYGLTETSSGVAISVQGDPRAMEVCPDDKITIADDGEILIFAPTCIMQGYYKDEKATREAIKNGVLYTGDLGYLDDEGKLHITGRKKEMLVLPSGTKIFLPEYESKLARALANPELAVILIDDKPALYIKEDEQNRAALQEKLASVMRELPRAQQISNIIFTDKPLPRTATGKIKRWEIQKSEEQKNGKND